MTGQKANKRRRQPLPLLHTALSTTAIGENETDWEKRKVDAYVKYSNCLTVRLLKATKEGYGTLPCHGYNCP